MHVYLNFSRSSSFKIEYQKTKKQEIKKTLSIFSISNSSPTPIIIFYKYAKEFNDITIPNAL